MQLLPHAVTWLQTSAHYDWEIKMQLLPEYQRHYTTCICVQLYFVLLPNTYSTCRWSSPVYWAITMFLTTHKEIICSDPKWTKVLNDVTNCYCLQVRDHNVNLSKCTHGDECASVKEEGTCILKATNPKNTPRMQLVDVDMQCPAMPFCACVSCTWLCKNGNNQVHDAILPAFIC